MFVLVLVLVFGFVLVFVLVFVFVLVLVIVFAFVFAIAMQLLRTDEQDQVAGNRLASQFGQEERPREESKGAEALLLAAEGVRALMPEGFGEASHVGLGWKRQRKPEVRWAGLGKGRRWKAGRH